MKRLLVLVFVLLLPVPSIFSQTYSTENLETKSLEELNILLEKSLKVKKTGTILSIGSPLALTGGLLLVNAGWSG